MLFYTTQKIPVHEIVLISVTGTLYNSHRTAQLYFCTTHVIIRILKIL